MEITPIIPSLSRKITPLVASYWHKGSKFEKLASGGTAIIAESERPACQFSILVPQVVRLGKDLMRSLLLDEVSSFRLCIATAQCSGNAFLITFKE